MTLIRADRVLEITATTGTGAYTLAGTEAGYQPFSAVCSNADTIEYVATDDVNWEVGLGTYNAGILTRSTIYASSNGGAAVNWGAGDKTIFCDIPAHFFGQPIPTAMNPVLTGDVTSPGGSTVTAIGAGKVTNAMLAGGIDLASKVTGILPIANGGTNASTGGAALENLDGASSTQSHPQIITRTGAATYAMRDQYTDLTSPTLLLHLRAAIGRIKAGTGNGVIACVGDSLTFGYYSNGSTTGNMKTLSFPTQLASALNAAGIPASSENFIGNGANANYQFDSRLSVGSGWSSYTGGFNSLGGEEFTASSATSPLAFTPSTPCDICKIYYVSTPALGSFKWNVDGGSDTTQSCAATSAFSTLTISLGSVGTHTINLNWVSGAIFIVGFDCYNSTIKQLRILNCGWPASTTSLWALDNSNPWSPARSLTTLAPDLTIIELGGNDMLTGVATPTVLTNLNTIVGLAQNSGSGDAMLIAYNHVDPAGTGVPEVTQATYIAQVYASALANNCAYVDEYDRQVSFAIANTLGFMAPDGVHQLGAGYADYAQAIYPVLNAGGGFTQTGNTSGNAATATALQTARNIGGVSFNGTANIVPQTIQSVNEASDTTCFPLFISASGSQSLQPLNNASLTYNASTGAFGSTSFSGAGTGLTGTAASLTAGVASAVAVGGITGLGTGVGTALAVNAGTAGAPLINGGALGTPSSGTATNLSGTAASLTAGAVAVGGVTGLGSGVATWLATPSSANLRAALTDESGTGAALFAGGNIGAATATSVNFGDQSLANYKEASWTPADNSGAGLSLTVTLANYTRIGRVVFITCNITYPTTVSGASASLSGLPFTVLANSGAITILGTNASIASDVVFTAGATTLTFNAVIGFAAITNSQLSGSVVKFSGFYFI